MKLSTFVSSYGIEIEKQSILNGICFSFFSLRLKSWDEVVYFFEARILDEKALIKNLLLVAQYVTMRFSMKSISSWERRSRAPRYYNSLQQTRITLLVKCWCIF